MKHSTVLIPSLSNVFSFRDFIPDGFALFHFNKFDRVVISDTSNRVYLPETYFRLWFTYDNGNQETTCKLNYSVIRKGDYIVVASRFEMRSGLRVAAFTGILEDRSCGRKYLAYTLPSCQAAAMPSACVDAVLISKHLGLVLYLSPLETFVSKINVYDFDDRHYFACI